MNDAFATNNQMIKCAQMDYIYQNIKMDEIKIEQSLFF